MSARLAGVLRRAASVVRHAPGFSSFAPLWSALRGPDAAALRALSGGSGVSVTVGGVAMRLGLPFAGVSWETIEPESYVAFRSACTAGGVVFDVGAHIGTYTIIAARAVGAHGQVVAFEPVPGTRGALVQHLEMNTVSDRVRVRDVALGDAPGMLDLFVTSPVGDAEASPATRPGAVAVRVVRSTVDAEQAQVARPVTVLKIDVEGQELVVLAGATRVLTHDRPVVLVSAHPAALAAQGRAVSDVTSLLAGHGYACRVVAQDHEVHILATPMAQ